MRGPGVLTEDREGQGLVVGQCVRGNFGPPDLDELLPCGLVDLAGEREARAGFVESLRIGPTGEIVDVPAATQEDVMRLAVA